MGFSPTMGEKNSGVLRWVTYFEESCLGSDFGEGFLRARRCGRWVPFLEESCGEANFGEGIFEMLGRMAGNVVRNVA
jgi:hypothetical protein